MHLTLIAGTLLSDTGGISVIRSGEPLGAFVAAYVGITIGRLVAGKTKLDLLITPAITIPFRWCCRDTGRTRSIKLHDMA